jgi:hypothetical protein
VGAGYVMLSGLAAGSPLRGSRRQGKDHRGHRHRSAKRVSSRECLAPAAYLPRSPAALAVRVGHSYAPRKLSRPQSGDGALSDSDGHRRGGGAQWNSPSSPRVARAGTTGPRPFVLRHVHLMGHPPRCGGTCCCLERSPGTGTAHSAGSEKGVTGEHPTTSAPALIPQ